MKTLVALVGTKHRGQEMLDLLASLPQGEPLTLVREPTNKVDPNAVQVWASGTHVGYLAAKQVKPIAMAMDAAAAGRVNVRSLDKPAKLARSPNSGYPMVDIDDSPAVSARKTDDDVG